MGTISPNFEEMVHIGFGEYYPRPLGMGMEMIEANVLLFLWLLLVHIVHDTSNIYYIVISITLNWF